MRGLPERLIFSPCAWLGVERHRKIVVVVSCRRAPPTAARDPPIARSDQFSQWLLYHDPPVASLFKTMPESSCPKRPSMRTPSKLHTYVETAKCVLHFVAHTPWLTPQMYKRFHCRCFHLQLPMHSCGHGGSHVHLCRSVANKR